MAKLKKEYYQPPNKFEMFGDPMMPWGYYKHLQFIENIHKTKQPVKINVYQKSI